MNGILDSEPRGLFEQRGAHVPPADDDEGRAGIARRTTGIARRRVLNPLPSHQPSYSKQQGRGGSRVALEPLVIASSISSTNGMMRGPIIFHRQLEWSEHLMIHPPEYGLGTPSLRGAVSRSEIRLGCEGVRHGPVGIQQRDAFEPSVPGSADENRKIVRVAPCRSLPMTRNPIASHRGSPSHDPCRLATTGAMARRRACSRRLREINGRCVWMTSTGSSAWRCWRARRAARP